MMSVNLPSHEIQSYLRQIASTDILDIHVSCINSPLNSTISGPEEDIDIVRRKLDQEGISAHKINTGVAYHSPAMATVASDYLALLGSLAPQRSDDIIIPMVSTVSGTTVKPSSLSEAKYWVDNLVSPVRFSDAISEITRGISNMNTPGNQTISDIIEVGPHGALRRPIRDSLGHTSHVHYNTVLDKSKSAVQSTLELLGALFSRGHPVSISAGNQQSPGTGRIPPLVNCPQYPFDHSQAYWVESRLSRDYRLRQAVRGGLLGWRSHDWNPLEPRWRNFITVEAYPWVADHIVSENMVLVTSRCNSVNIYLQISDTILFPAAGMLIMALEAIQDVSSTDRQISGYFVKRAEFSAPIIVRNTPTGRAETVVRLLPVKKPYEREVLWFDIRISSNFDDQWRECFQARIQVQYEKVEPVWNSTGFHLARAHGLGAFEHASKLCTTPIDCHTFYSYCEDQGLKYGKCFRLLDDIRWDGNETSVARVDVSGPKYQTSSIIHPAVLDTAFQVLLAQASKGLTKPTYTNVPYQLTDLWISSSGWQYPQVSSLHYLAKASKILGGNGIRGTIDIMSDDGSSLCTVSGIVTRSVSRSNDKTQASQRMLYNVIWKPQLRMLDSTQMQRACESDFSPADETFERQYRFKLNRTLKAVMLRFRNALSVEDRQRAPEPLQKYCTWIEHHTSQMCMSRDNIDELIEGKDLEAHFKDLEEVRPSWRLAFVMARNLGSILHQKIDPLHLAFETNLAEDLYTQIFQSHNDQRFRRLLELMCHENPRQRILEVGAGTGAWTTLILSNLKQFEEQSGASSFSHYTFADISPSFFERARMRFVDYKGRMDFKAFDANQKPNEQGFKLGSYDVIFAGSVLHATKDIAATMRNLRLLLKSTGYLVIQESTVPEDIGINFTFGVLPGWWLFKDEWRSVSPLMNKADWNTVLSQNGFSGAEMVLDDFQDDLCHISSVIFSKATNLEPVAAPRPDILITVDTQSTKQLELSKVLKDKVLASAGYNTSVISLDQVSRLSSTDGKIVICLVEVDKPLLARLTSETFQSVKRLVGESKRLLWVTATNINDEGYPYYSVVKGFLRCMRLELSEHQIVHLEMDSQCEDINISARHTLNAMTMSFESETPERDLVVRDEQITTGRLVEEISLDETVTSLAHPQSRNEPFGKGSPLKLEIGTPGFLETLQFVEDDTYQAELASCEVEVETKVWGVSNRDIFVALGRFEDGKLGCDGAGIITRVGSSCISTFSPGDRVCYLALDSIRSYVRVPMGLVAKIPSELSLETAAAIMSPGITAYYALDKVAQLRKGEKILIHSAAGGTGQMAIWIARSAGAEIFATVGNDEKKQLLINEFGLAADHIFSSRDTSFSQSVKYMTNQHGVDVVLNSLPGDGLRASWECIAPFGRFIEIGKADIMIDSSLPMASFAKNVSFRAVDLGHLIEADENRVSNLQKELLDLVATGTIGVHNPLHVFPGSEVEKAFRYMQSGKNTGRIVITPRGSDIVPVSTLTRSQALLCVMGMHCRKGGSLLIIAQKFTVQRTSWILKQDASYLIVGGFGGLGRAIMTWLATKGAKYLIVVSRSGASSEAAVNVVSDLSRQGVRIAAPKCDASSSDSLTAALKACTGEGMPPIRGCINAAMVLQVG